MDATFGRKVCWLHSEKYLAKVSKYEQHRQGSLRKYKGLAKVHELLQYLSSPVRKKILISVGKPFEQVSHRQARRYIEGGKVDIHYIV